MKISIIQLCFALLFVSACGSKTPINTSKIDESWGNAPSKIKVEEEETETETGKNPSAPPSANQNLGNMVSQKPRKKVRIPNIPTKEPSLMESKVQQEAPTNNRKEPSINDKKYGADRDLNK